MLSSDLTVVDNASSVTLPGSKGSKTYSEIVSNVPDTKKRHIAADALTTPKILLTSQKITGKGWKQRRQTVVRLEYSDLTADTSITGGEVPALAITLTVNSPVNSGGAITAAIIKDCVGAVTAVITASGQLDKLITGEL